MTTESYKEDQVKMQGEVYHEHMKKRPDKVLLLQTYEPCNSSKIIKTNNTIKHYTKFSIFKENC